MYHVNQDSIPEIKKVLKIVYKLILQSNNASLQQDPFVAKELAELKRQIEDSKFNKKVY